jgi:hypothetical protein
MGHVDLNYEIANHASSENARGENGPCGAGNSNCYLETQTVGVSPAAGMESGQFDQ